MRTPISCLLVALASCGEPAAQGPARGDRVPSAGAQSGASEEVGVPELPAEGYRVDVEAPAHAPGGQPVLARVSVRPHAPWHMNAEFPVKLRMSAAAGIDFDNALLQRDDAEQLDDHALVFPLVFTPRKEHRGAAMLQGELHFAVCGAAECAPIRVPVAFSVEIT